ncbi:hypothetical protein E4U42_002713 [Claviceps africana]|uniref:Uncharacterized protein n=1 Tax=Claviceps africana TaxID=83212 RepID=A0A8K0J8A2_9HYPO|nr:hypothetical protein E4U42_002713 [Claviceps africana]
MDRSVWDFWSFGRRGTRCDWVVSDEGSRGSRGFSSVRGVRCAERCRFSTLGSRRDGEPLDEQVQWTLSVKGGRLGTKE